MRFRHLMLAGAMVSASLGLAGCNDQGPQEYPWQITKEGNDVLLHNGQTGDVFAFVDGTLMEIDKVRQSELGTHSMETWAMPDQSVHLDVTTVYREGRVMVKVVAKPDPEAEDFAAITELETVYDGEHEALKDLVIELRDTHGMTLASMDLSDFSVTRNQGLSGGVEQLTFRDNERMAPTTYELIDSANVLWYNR